MKNYRKTLLTLFCLAPFAVWAQFPYLDGSLPIEVRVNDLVSRMTLEEKVSQMMHTSKGIERLKVPPCNWWNECLHGVAPRRKQRSFLSLSVWERPLIRRP
jgi:beta-glucosidase